MPRTLVLRPVLAAVLLLHGAIAAVADTARRQLTDLAGRTVELPTEVRRVATLGPVPVINSFVFAIGKGDTLVNGLPPFARSARWKYQSLIAPNLSRQPQAQGFDNAPQLETLQRLAPDAVFAMDASTVRTVERTGLPVLFLAWRDAGDIGRIMQLMGEVFDRRERADAYTRYFDGVLERVRTAVAGVATEQRPKVLYFSLKTLTQPHLIADWWIQAAGGISVTADGRRTESVRFTPEQVFAWDPDVLIVSSPEELAQIRHDARFRRLRAVRERKIHAIPAGVHPWGHRTAEQPLTVLWAAGLFHPSLFPGLNMTAEIKDFYRRFFDYPLSDRQAEEILHGNPK